MKSTPSRLRSGALLALIPCFAAIPAPAPAAPLQQIVVQGRVYYDPDEDGFYLPQSTSDTPIEGWKIRLTSGAHVEESFTNAEGQFMFVRPLDGALITLESFAPAPGFVGIAGGQWLPTNSTVVNVVARVPRFRVAFGNVFLESTPQYARSKGYWHNQGESELAACDPLWRETINALCLRTNITNANGQEGTLFTVSLNDPFATSFGQLSSYLVAPANGVLANILSTQYAAANLNRSCGPLADFTTYIDRFGDGVLVSFEEMAAVTLGLLCDPRAANTGPGGDAEWRAMIMMCLNEWEDMNSIGDSIYTPRSTQPDFETPY